MCLVSSTACKHRLIAPFGRPGLPIRSVSFHRLTPHIQYIHGRTRIPAFPPMCKCRCRFEVFALKNSSDFSFQISILVICTYFSEKKVITESKMLKCTYCPLQECNGKTSDQQSALKSPEYMKAQNSNRRNVLSFLDSL